MKEKAISIVRKNIVGLVLTLTLFIISILTFLNLMNYYVNSEIGYNEWSVVMGSKLETDLASNTVRKMSFVNLNGLVRRILNEPEMNNVVKLKNGYLATLLNEVPEDDIKCRAVDLKKTQEKLAEKDIDFLFVMVPYSVSKYDPEIPVGYSDYGNLNLDKLSDQFTKQGVNFIDIRECFHQEGLNQYDYWYKTDHHWTTQGGFYAFTKIVDYLSISSHLEVDSQILNVENYKEERYAHYHLGSNGQRTGKYYAGIDDFVLYVPLFDTSINDTNSRLENVLYNYEPLASRNYESRYTYDHVLETYGRFSNNLSKNDKRAIVICDSMGRAVMPFLTLAFSEIECISSDYLEAEIEQFKPDVVISLVHPMNIGITEYTNSFWPKFN